VKDLQGKVAVVTGGASGIGRAMAERFASEGMKVVLADVEASVLAACEQEMRAAGATVASKRTDVSRGEDVEALARFAADAFGGVHVLCNNAGVGGRGGASWDEAVEDWQWVLGVNLWGVIHGVHAFTYVEQAEAHRQRHRWQGCSRGRAGVVQRQQFGVVALSERCTTS
jgi:NAD(P)-dependent dehydrogenase (short-subunit alcohol dehydrogenase family)